MAINKVEYGNTTLIDLTDMTAVASDVASGKTFYGKDGVLTTGTATSGLEYEEGTFEPEEDVSRPTINFAKTHSKMPIMISIWDATDTYDATLDANFCWTMVNFGDINNTYMQTTASSKYYGIKQYWYRSSTGSTSGNVTAGSGQFTYPSSSATSTSISYPRYYYTESYFKPYSTASRYWRAGRTYKWIAIWK